LLLFAAAVSADSDTLADSTDGDSKSAVVSGALALVPTAGQWYTGAYVRGSLLAAGGLVGGLYTAFWHSEYMNLKPAVEALVDSAATLGDSVWYDTSYNQQTGTIDTTAWIAIGQQLDLAADSANIKLQQALVRRNNAAAWLAGTYVYSILQAMEHTGAFYSESPRSPSKAAMLSAVPGLGLGQMYNGELAKAGVIWTVQSSLAVMAYQYHKLMTLTEESIEKLENMATQQPNTTIDSQRRRELLARFSSQRSNFFRTRNTYLWYGILFYFYGIFDALVDAHLHDYPAQIALVPTRRGIAVDGAGMLLTFSF